MWRKTTTRQLRTTGRMNIQSRLPRDYTLLTNTMASNILSRLLPPNFGAPSIYETMREHDQSSEYDIEERAGMALDEENMGVAFRDSEVDEALTDVDASHLHTSKLLNPKEKLPSPPRRVTPKQRRPSLSPKMAEEEDDLDDEVPMSLLIEGDEDPAGAGERRQSGEGLPPAPSSRSRGTRAQWQATQEQQRLHHEMGPRNPTQRIFGRAARLNIVDAKEKAMWRWANVENLDNFLREVYDYYIGNGIWSMLLHRLLNLLTLAFVVGFSTFLSSCINYKKVPSSKHMSEILVPKCGKNMSRSANVLIWIFVFLWICKLFQLCLDIHRLRHMHDFYHHLLEIPDTDIQTVSWQEVVKRLMLLRDSNPTTAAGVSERHRRFIGSQSKQRMDAHDIANRLMRRDNYLIALINKDILDLTLPIPFMKNRQLFSKTLEWNLSLCILDYVFDEHGQFQTLILKDTHRKELSDGLRRRFMFAGLMNVLCGPFIISYAMMLYFFRYFNEYQKNPSEIGSRQYTPLAEWKFREFNELWHLFQRRINMSYPFASRYVNQFPKDKTIQLCRFVAFVTGALASVLALASVIDPELFLGFEITPERTVLFYLGIFGTVWAVARGAVPEETLVFDPEYALSNVTDYTHYLPSHWRGRLHSDEVRAEFALLYQMKVVTFLEEILSIIFTPFILWFSLPQCSDRIVDFFREFTLHVDGLGYVCSFAVFDFKKGGNTMAQQIDKTGQDPREDYYSTKDGKMLASYYGFIDNYVTNQRGGIPFMPPSAKRNFHPPPAFPAMMSNTMAADGNMHTATRNDRSNPHQRKHSRSSFAVPGQRTPRFAPVVGQPSPMASILLDPQHQPSQSGLRTPHRFGTQSRMRASRKPLIDPVEDEDEEEEGEGEERDGARPLSGGGDGSEGIGAESNLGESWKTTRAGAVEGEDEEDGQATNHDRGPGVLGLVYQFSKAQTERRGTAVNI